MKKQVIYTNKDNQDFGFNRLDGGDIIDMFAMEIFGGSNALFFTDMDGIKDFCETMLLEASMVFGHKPTKDATK